MPPDRPKAFRRLLWIAALLGGVLLLYPALVDPKGKGYEAILQGSRFAVRLEFIGGFVGLGLDTNGSGGSPGFELRRSSYHWMPYGSMWVMEGDSVHLAVPNEVVVLGLVALIVGFGRLFVCLHRLRERRTASAEPGLGGLHLDEGK